MKVLEGSLDAARSGRGGEEPAEQKSKAAPGKTARTAAAKKTAKAPARNAPPKKAEAASARSRGSGTGGKRELQKLSKAEMYQQATDRDVAGRSKVSREELIDALARSGRRRKKSAA
ncbi:hypothetical protein [Streptomyces sp. NPDC001480]|uniref:hypothetical protein n=1 Tax=Streptomyces sp. NPDC001480 TaxID=3364577 RepID=UPI00367FADA2